MTTSLLRSALFGILPALAVCTFNAAAPAIDQASSSAAAQASVKETEVQIEYLEIVTPDVEATCSSLEKLHGVEFSAPIPEFGNARTAKLASGGLLGVRAPMRADEEPVVRPYVRVDDIESAVKAAEAAGAEIAIPGMAIPGRGKFAIYIHGGIQHGLWEL